MKIIRFILISVLISCSSPQRKPATLAGSEIEDLRAYIDFKDTGLAMNKRNYDLYLEIFTNKEVEDEKNKIIGVEAIVDGTSVHWFKFKTNPLGDVTIKERLPIKLAEQNTVIRVLFVDGYKDFPLVCTRLGKC